jgi:hypothetical protein
MYLVLANNVTGDATDEASVESNKTPFLPGRTVGAVIDVDAATGTDAVIIIESSPDDSTWTTVLTHTGIGGVTVGNVKCDKYMYVGVTTAAGTVDGTYSAYLQSGD